MRCTDPPAPRDPCACGAGAPQRRRLALSRGRTAAAIVHDLGRTREFTLGAEIGLTDEGRLLGHVEIGLRMLDERSGPAGLDDARRLALAHCVLTHHGADAAPQRRFGSAEALALHRLNAVDAGIKGAFETGSVS